MPDNPGAQSPVELPALGAIGRRALPNLLEATIVPAALFWVVLTHVGAGPAMVVTLTWSCGAVTRRLFAGERLPSILVLSVAGMVLRTAVGLATGSATLYFVQPLIAAAAMGLVFLGSLLVGRPLAASIASDFCPLSAEVAGRPGVVSLFRRLTALWALIHLTTAAVTLALLETLPLATFVAVKTAACMAITGGGVALTLSWSLRTARQEGLVVAGSPGSESPGQSPALAMLAPAA